MPGKRSNGEGTLRKRSNGLWECTMMVGYKDDGTRRYKSFYGKSQKEAKDKADAYKQEVAAGLYIDPNLTFQAWAQKWYEGYRDSVSPTTYESYGYTLKTLVKGFGPRKLGSIKALDVENFLKGLRADGKSDSYLAKCRGMLYQIMHKAEANDLIRKNPVRFAEKMKAQRPVQRKEAFTQEEVQKLMEGLPQDRTGHTIRLMLATGMRTQEVLALEPRHIEPDGSCVHIRQAVNMVKGKPYIGPPKSAASVRDVPVPPNVRPCAVFLREQAGKFIWESPIAGQPVNPSHFRDKYRNALFKVPGVRMLTPHSCRHTYVSQLQALGVDMETIQSMVGHADMEMTQHYLHVQEEVRQAAAEKFSKTFKISRSR